MAEDFLTVLTGVFLLTFESVKSVFGKGLRLQYILATSSANTWSNKAAGGGNEVRKMPFFRGVRPHGSTGGSLAEIKVQPSVLPDFIWGFNSNNKPEASFSAILLHFYLPLRLVHIPLACVVRHNYMIDDNSQSQ